MTSLEALSPAYDVPAIYLACPLTGLDPDSRRHVLADVGTVKNAVARATRVDRVDEDTWPVQVYAPIDHTAPWLPKTTLASEVYERNLSRVHHSDALIIVAEDGGSSGVGQELEWGIQLGLPILYLSADDTISRQIRGAPAFVDVRSYNGDPQTLEQHVLHFLRQWKALILDGPRRRESRAIRFTEVTTRLRAAWNNARNPTGIAAQARVDLEYLELALSDPLYVAAMPTDTLLSIADALSVPLGSLSQSPPSYLAVPQQRALFAAANEDGWTDAEVQDLLYLGRMVLVDRGPAALTTLQEWRQLRSAGTHLDDEGDPQGP